MIDQLFETPVLFLIFNRLDTTKEVFTVLQNVKPKYLFIGADGPRSEKEGESLLCLEVRDYVLRNINWECDVKTLFRNENLGCGKAVSEAITWFFNHVEEGIILEDDCLPDETFFKFSEELLKKYRYNSEVMIITGSNLLGNWKVQKYSYFFGHCSIWGWASWRRAWNFYDKTMRGWPQETIREKLKKGLFFEGLYNFYRSMFESAYNGSLDTWDVQWFYSIIINDGRSITPSVNLIKNIGFNSNATHTLTPDVYIESIPLFQMKFPLRHPSTDKTDVKYIKSMYKTLVKGYKNGVLQFILKLSKWIYLKTFKLIIKRNE